MNVDVTMCRYQLRSMGKSPTIFGIVMFGVVLISLIVSLFSAVEEITFMSIEISAAVTVGICGLNVFRESFGFGLQNGVARKHIYSGTVLGGLAFALIFALIEEGVLLLSAGAELIAENLRWVSVAELLYAQRFQNAAGIKMHLESLGFNFAVNWALFMMGYLIAISCYRMNKTAKILVSSGFLVFFGVVVPALDILIFGGRLFGEVGRLLVKLFGIAKGNIWCGTTVFVAIGAVMSALSWPLIRRAVVKE